MKYILILATAISVCFLFKMNKDKTAYLSTLKSQSDTIIYLKNQKYVKDSLMMSIEDSFKDEKEAIRFKKIYFSN